jgi:pimeloyl-ACP methyl ester carboxylesterase
MGVLVRKLFSYHNKSSGFNPPQSFTIEVRKLMVFLWAGLGLIILGLAWLFRPLVTRHLSAIKPAEIAGYDAAVALFQSGMANKEGVEILAPCHSILMGHGEKTGRAIILLHGLTNCPKQFEKLGREFFDMGYNVLVPRMPLHGMADRMNGKLVNITAEDLKTFTEESFAIAQGLGERVSVVGLSGGGVLAAWLAQFCSAIEAAVIISPSLGLYRSKVALNDAFTKLLLRLPNIYNLRTPENLLIAPPYVQIKNSSRAAAQYFRLGITIFQAARQQGPACQRIIVVSNASDLVINNALVKRLAGLWQARSTGQVITYEFPAAAKLPHDLIDPNAKVDHSAEVYPILLDLIKNAWNV